MQQTAANTYYMQRTSILLNRKDDDDYPNITVTPSLNEISDDFSDCLQHKIPL